MSTETSTLAEHAEPTARTSLIRKLMPFTGLIAVVLEIVFFASQAPTFLSGQNIINITVQASVVALAAFGLSIVIIIGGDDVINGGIDLSVGAVIGLTGSVIAVQYTSGQDLVASLLWGLGAALAVGAVNAIGVLIGIRPLLVTLATMGIAGSADLLVSNNLQIALREPFFIWMRDARILGVPFAVLLVILVFMVVWSIVGGTGLGVRSYAVGGNPLAAKVAGINNNRYVAVSYLCSAATAALAGLLLVARLSGSSPGAGTLLLLDVILASFMSVIFSRRLVVNIPGTLVGALFVGALTNGFTLINVPTYWVSGVKGVLILVVVAVSAIRVGRRS